MKCIYRDAPFSHLWCVDQLPKKNIEEIDGRRVSIKIVGYLWDIIWMLLVSITILSVWQSKVPLRQRKKNSYDQKSFPNIHKGTWTCRDIYQNKGTRILCLHMYMRMSNSSQYNLKMYIINNGKTSSTLTRESETSNHHHRRGGWKIHTWCHWLR